MALTGVHLILINLGLDLVQTKYFLVETEDEVGADYEVGTDYKVLHRPLQPVSNLQLDLSGRYDTYQFYFMLLNVGDQNNDGTLTMKEMMEVWKKLEGKDTSEEEAQEALKMIDKNNNGVFEKCEIDTLDTKALESVFNSWDQDDDGFLRKKELIGVFKTIARQKNWC